MTYFSAKSLTSGRFCGRSAGCREAERGEIVERNAHAARQQGLEAVAEDVVAVERQRAIGEAVESVLAVDAIPGAMKALRLACAAARASSASAGASAVVSPARIALAASATPDHEVSAWPRPLGCASYID
jgi:hypothetical protein